MTARLVAAGPDKSEDSMALLSYVRQPRLDGHWSLDGLVATVDHPATAELVPGTYALLAQSLHGAECDVQVVQVAPGTGQTVDVRLQPGRTVTIDFRSRVAEGVERGHFLVLQDGESILVQIAGPWAIPLVLPDRDLVVELHAAGCASVSRTPLPRGVEVLHVP